MKEQILALAVQSGFKLDWVILNCTGQFESFYHAAIESYKAELLKEAGEPVGCHYLPNNEMFPVEEVSRSNLKNNPQDYVFLYTSDQVAAAILKTTGPLEKEIERLKTVPMKYRRMAFNAQLQDENAELRQQLASAQVDNDQLRAELAALKAENEWQPIETAPKDEAVFLAWRKHATHPLMVRYEPSYDWFANYDGEHVYDLTHWMPLPKPPADDELRQWISVDDRLPR